jgi:hypothetical protein
MLGKLFKNNSGESMVGQVVTIAIMLLVGMLIFGTLLGPLGTQIDALNNSDLTGLVDDVTDYSILAFGFIGIGLFIFAAKYIIQIVSF